MGKIDLADKLDGARARVEAEASVEDRGLAKFARLTRKDARVRADQDAALTALAKRVMRRRPVKAERITENTLIRVAIDLLLTRADELSGSTEDELRISVTSEVPNSRTSEHPNSRSTELADTRASDAAHAVWPARPGAAASTVQPARSRSDAPARAPFRDATQANAASGVRSTRRPSDPLATLAPSIHAVGIQ